MIYPDNTATTHYRPDAVVNTAADIMRHTGNVGRGIHGASLGASRIIHETRGQLAKLSELWRPGGEFCGRPSGAALTADSTESLNIMIQGLFQPGDHVITIAMEHNSALRPLYLMGERGLGLSIAPVDKEGNTHCEDSEYFIRPSTEAIAYTHVLSLTGDMIDVERMDGVCRKYHLLLIVGASQDAGVFNIDMEKMGVDVLCFIGHESLMGPQGVDGIRVQDGIRIRPPMVGGDGVHSYSKTHPDTMPIALGAGALNGHGIADFHAALVHLGELGSSVVGEKEQWPISLFYHDMKDIPGVTVYGDFNISFWAPIATLNIGNYDSGKASGTLTTDHGILTCIGAYRALLMHEALGAKEQGAVWFSLSFYDTEEETRTAVRAAEELT